MLYNLYKSFMCRSPLFADPFSIHMESGFSGLFARLGFLCRWVSLAMAGELAKQWERVETIRKRFRGGISWIQWPIPERPSMEVSDTDEGPKPNPICTKSLELNFEALATMLEYFNGGFCDIKQVELEASTWVTWGCKFILTNVLHSGSISSRNISTPFPSTFNNVLYVLW